MLCARGQKRSHLQKEFRLEKENFARGTSYVGIEISVISFFFVKPTVSTYMKLCTSLFVLPSPQDSQKGLIPTPALLTHQAMRG